MFVPSTLRPAAGSPTVAPELAAFDPGGAEADLFGGRAPSSPLTGVVRGPEQALPGGARAFAELPSADERIAAALRDKDVGGPRYTVDSRATIGYPLVPCRDALNTPVAASGERRFSYPAIGWQIVHPATLPGQAFPAGTVTDVWAGLMFLLAVAGYPDDGEIEFSRYQFLQLIGWVGTGKKPSGRHYQMLKTAFEYLRKTGFVSDHPDTWQRSPDGVVFKGAQAFNLLEYWRLVEDQTGPKGETEAGLPARCAVIFTRKFMQFLARGAATATLDFDLFLSLRTGSPRQLFRVLADARLNGATAIEVEELLQRMGSKQTECVPARVRQILGEAHRALRERGVLAEEPTFVKDRCTGRWSVQYVFGDPAAALREEEMLVDQAIAYGVVPAAARELAVAHRANFEAVLAAATLGLIRPKKTLAAMIVTLTRRGPDALALELQGSRATRASRAGQFFFDLDTVDTRYIAWAARLREERVRERRDLHPALIRDEILRQPHHGTANRAAWVIEGLVAIRTNQRLGIRTLHEFRHETIEGRDAAALLNG